MKIVAVVLAVVALSGCTVIGTIAGASSAAEHNAMVDAQAEHDRQRFEAERAVMPETIAKYALGEAPPPPPPRHRSIGHGAARGAAIGALVDGALMLLFVGGMSSIRT